MNFLLLVVALAIPADAPKADMKEAAAAPAAVAVESVPVEPEVAFAEATGTSLPPCERIIPLQAARTALTPCEIAPVGSSQEVRAKEVGVIAEPKKDGDCSLVDVFGEKHFLSGPWSAKRRLDAARIRGDTDEARRMEARLGELVEEALGVEDEGADDD